MEPAVDLRSLAPDNEVEAEQAFVAATMFRIAAHGPIKVARDPLIAVWHLARPWPLAAALALATVLWIAKPEDRVARPRTVAEAVGVPPAFLPSAASDVRRAP